jgi:hypothetical protein
MGVATPDQLILTIGCQSQADLHLLQVLAPYPVRVPALAPKDNGPSYEQPAKNDSQRAAPEKGQEF